MPTDFVRLRSACEDEPLLASNLAQYERADWLMALSTDNRVFHVKRNGVEWFTTGGPDSVHELVDAYAFRCVPFLSPTERGLREARLRSAAEALQPATGFSDVVSGYARCWTEMAERGVIPPVLAGVPLVERDPSGNHDQIFWPDVKKINRLNEPTGGKWLLARMESLGLSAKHLSAQLSEFMTRSTAASIPRVMAGRFFIDRHRLAREAGLATNTVVTALNGLEDRKVIVPVPSTDPMWSGVSTLIPEASKRLVVYYQPEAALVYTTHAAAVLHKANTTSAEGIGDQANAMAELPTEDTKKRLGRRI